MGFVLQKTGYVFELPWKIKSPWKFLKEEEDGEWKQGRMGFQRRGSTTRKQVCFLHLAKTAGSSINEILRRRCADHSGIGVLPENMDRLAVGGLRKLGLVSAHFSIRHLPLLHPRRYLFTFLRDPVDRVISNYYYLRAYDGRFDTTNTTVLTSAKTKSFHNFLLDDHPQVRSFTNNMQANALAWDWRGDSRRESPHLGRIAIASLKHFDFVGLFERYEESLHELFKQLQWRLEPDEAALVVNKTGHRPLLSQIEPSTLSLIRELNQADQELYDFVSARASDSGFLNDFRNGADGYPLPLGRRPDVREGIRDWVLRTFI